MGWLLDIELFVSLAVWWVIPASRPLRNFTALHKILLQLHFESHKINDNSNVVNVFVYLPRQMYRPGAQEHCHWNAEMQHSVPKTDILLGGLIF